MATDDDRERLLAAEKATTPRHMLGGYYLGKVIDVYDGDTGRVAFVTKGGDLEYVRVRMLGYDAPEMKKDHRPYGLEVRDVLRALVGDRLVVMYVPPPARGPDAENPYGPPVRAPDPYGRTLAYLFAAPAGAPVRATPPPRNALQRLLARCLPPRGPAYVEALAASNTEADALEIEAEANLGLDEIAVTVRGREVAVPAVGDIPARFNFGALAGETAPALGLLNVNAWMIANARVIVYDGAGGRPGYTAEELANGVD